MLAGAGSGKTTVLVQRIAYMVKYGNAYFNEDIDASLLFEPFVEKLESIAMKKIRTKHFLKMLWKLLQVFLFSRITYLP